MTGGNDCDLQNDAAQGDAPSPPPLPAPSVVRLGYADGKALPGPSINPWHRRKKRGAFIDFWATVWWVMRRNGRLGPALAEPSPWRDARKFRRWCVGHCLAAVVLVCATLAVRIHHSGGLPNFDHSTYWLIGLAAVGLLLTWACLQFMAGAVSWFFCPKGFDTEQQNRSIALSCYLCAPMALIGVVGIALGMSALGAAVATEEWSPARPLYLILTWGPVVYWWQLLLFGARSVARRGWKGLLITAVGLPAAWAVISLATTLVGWSLLMWGMMYLSLT